MYRLLLLTLALLSGWVLSVAPAQDVRIVRSSNARTPPDRDAKLAFSDANHFYAIGRSRALVYEVGAMMIGRPAATVDNLTPGTEIRSVTSDGRKAILAVADSSAHVHLVLLDTTTGQREDIPSSWYDPTDSDAIAALSGDGRLVSIYSESGPADSPMTVTVYDWPTKTLVVKRTSEYISAGGGFGGGVTTDGEIEFENNRVGRKIVDLKTGRLLGWFGFDSVRSPDGVWVVDFPDRTWNESAPKDVLLKDGTNGQTRGKLDLQVADDQTFGSMHGAFCGTTGRFVLAGGRAVALYTIAGGNLLASFPAASWRDPNVDDTDRPTVACSSSETRVAILSGSRLTFHDLK
jgi:hypothetical protein